MRLKASAFNLWVFDWNFLITSTDLILYNFVLKTKILSLRSVFLNFLSLHILFEINEVTILITQPINKPVQEPIIVISVLFGATGFVGGFAVS